VPSDIVRRAFGYVEGFNAAHAQEISVNALVRAGEAEEKIGGQQSFRIQGGYNFVPRTLLAMCDPQHLRINMDTVVERVEWERGRVSVSVSEKSSAAEIKSRMAIVTLPLGVLKSGAVEFSPALETKREALEKLAVGHVIRVVLRFRERFWDTLQPGVHGDGRDASATVRDAGAALADMRFLFTDDEWFPTWWSTMPRRAPVLVAWAPASAAEKLSGRGEQFQVKRALQSLSEHLPVSRERLQQLLERGFVHDWQADPFARGAYSYVCAGGGKAEQQLAESIEQTLYFAGEATDTNGYFGTVHGAIASGYRAAEEILQGVGNRA
jgi:monoamine oxidase